MMAQTDKEADMRLLLKPEHRHGGYLLHREGAPAYSPGGVTLWASTREELAASARALGFRQVASAGGFERWEDQEPELDYYKLFAGEVFIDLPRRGGKTAASDVTIAARECLPPEPERDHRAYLYAARSVEELAKATVPVCIKRSIHAAVEYGELKLSPGLRFAKIEWRRKV